MPAGGAQRVRPRCRPRRQPGREVQRAAAARAPAAASPAGPPQLGLEDHGIMSSLFFSRASCQLSSDFNMPH